MEKKTLLNNQWVKEEIKGKKNYKLFLKQMKIETIPEFIACKRTIIKRKFTVINNFFLKLYNIVLVLPYINMNLPQVYTCSPSWTLLHLRTIPLGHPSATAPSIQYRASNLDWRLVSYIYYTCFNAILPNDPTLSLSHRVQKTVLYISVSFAVSYTGLLLPSF